MKSPASKIEARTSSPWALLAVVGASLFASIVIPLGLVATLVGADERLVTAGVIAFMFLPFVAMLFHMFAWLEQDEVEALRSPRYVSEMAARSRVRVYDDIIVVRDMDGWRVRTRIVPMYAIVDVTASARSSWISGWRAVQIALDDDELDAITFFDDRNADRTANAIREAALDAKDADSNRMKSPPLPTSPDAGINPVRRTSASIEE